ncbi:hypothetical protein AMJ40_03270 [candidate division TA06 bacterium DG_26]|uniref:Uncharacterized protein n=1 Tax=candidate division TA06 bacterium DG_26 TaxID=1703771 RepID=A0A0S7WJF5_UNCT6|nr:MAG: hypothetical protein AMJ40_03270 [candidate division TA06 bacterium DG_26]
MKKLLLISPFFSDRVKKPTEKPFLIPPLNLPIVASLTPQDYEVVLVDENIEDTDFEQDVDLVGITAMTAQAPRAYRIADTWRKRGVRVVMGGIHPTAVPEEAAQHSDAVVIGEVENIWAQVIKDAETNGLKKFYRSVERPCLKELPYPRLDLLRSDRYIVCNVIQVFRGCPFNCRFCSVTNFFGNTYRYKPVDDVVREVQLRVGDTRKSRFFGFVDDNIGGLPSYAKELFTRLIPFHIIWGGQASLTIARDRELMRIFERSGCKALFIGLESASQAALHESNKNFLKVSQFKEAIKIIHDHGIGVEGAFIFGFDDDDHGVFERTVEFADRIGVDAAQFGILTPFPGTAVWEKMVQEHRIISDDWARYTIGHVVFDPKKMSPERLQEGADWAWREFYSLRKIGKRFIRSLNYGLKLAVPILIFQFAYRSLLKTRENSSKLDL